MCFLLRSELPSNRECCGKTSVFSQRPMSDLKTVMRIILFTHILHVFFAVTVNQGRAYVTTTLKSSARLRMGGSCTRFGGCKIIKPDVSTVNFCELNKIQNKNNKKNQ